MAEEGCKPIGLREMMVNGPDGGAGRVGAKLNFALPPPVESAAVAVVDPVGLKQVVAGGARMGGGGGVDGGIGAHGPDAWLIGRDGVPLPVHESSVRFVKEFGDWSHYKAG